MEKIELPEGSYYSVKCFVDQIGFPYSILKWFKDNIEISTSSDLISKSRNFIALHFSRLKKEQSGNYKCHIKNSEGNQEKEIQLLVFGEYFIF